MPSPQAHRSLLPLVALAIAASSPAFAASVRVYGPVDVSRDNGKPQSVVLTFSSPDPSAPHTLRIDNGGLGGEMRRIASAEIWLNGVRVLEPNRFNGSVSIIETPIRPKDENTLVVQLRAKPRAGITIQVTAVDTVPPVISDIFPEEGTVVSRPEVTLSMKVEDLLSGVVSVTCDGVAATAAGDGYACTVPLVEGPNAIAIEATDGCGNMSVATRTIRYDPPPVVSISDPADGAVLFGSPVDVTGTVDDPSSDVSVNGVPATGAPTFTASVPVPNGENTLTARAVDPFGGEGTDSVDVTVLTPGVDPTLSITSPPDGFVLGGPATSTFPPKIVTVHGRIRVVQPFNGGNAPDVSVEGIDARVFKGGSPGPLCGTPLAICWWDFEAKGIVLSEGSVTITATGTDRAGRTDTARITGIVDVCIDGDSTGPARVGTDQSNRCHKIDGCSTPDIVAPDVQDPASGTLGHGSTAFGKDTDAESPPERFPHGASPRDRLPCNLHDVCYQTCGSDKVTCDKRMYDDMLDVCHRAYPEAICPYTVQGPLGTRVLDPVKCPQWRDEKNRCYRWADIYRAGLTAGGPRFSARQMEYCLP